MILRLAIPLIALLTLATTTFAQEDAGNPAGIAALEQEVALLNERMTQVEIEESRLAAREAELEKRVEALKNAPSGVMRDAELQTALRDLRSVLGQVRNLTRVEKILVTTLRTRQVDLVQASTLEAAQLTRRGEQAVRAGDDEAAMAYFARAYRYLERGQGPQARSLMGHGARREERQHIPADIPLTGRESPDELRKLAIILRDTAEKLKTNARMANDELNRFREERNILRTLQRVETAPSPSMDTVLAFLEKRIDSLMAELAAIRTGLSVRLAAATALERQATQYEAVLLNEAHGSGGAEP